MPRRFSLDGRSSASAGAEASSSKEAKINEELWEQLYALRKRSNKTYEGKPACERCRAKRTGCDRGEPSCTKCTMSGHECVYSSNNLMRRGPPSAKERKILDALGVKPRSLQRRHQPWNKSDGTPRSKDASGGGGASSSATSPSPSSLHAAGLATGADALRNTSDSNSEYSPLSYSPLQPFSPFLSQVPTPEEILSVQPSAEASRQTSPVAARLGGTMAAGHASFPNLAYVHPPTQRSDSTSPLSPFSPPAAMAATNSGTNLSTFAPDSSDSSDQSAWLAAIQQQQTHLAAVRPDRRFSEPVPVLNGVDGYCAMYPPSYGADSAEAGEAAVEGAAQMEQADEFHPQQQFMPPSQRIAVPSSLQPPHQHQQNSWHAPPLFASDPQHGTGMSLAYTNSASPVPATAAVAPQHSGMIPPTLPDFLPFVGGGGNNNSSNSLSLIDDPSQQRFSHDPALFHHPNLASSGASQNQTSGGGGSSSGSSIDMPSLALDDDAPHSQYHQQQQQQQQNPQNSHNLSSDFASNYFIS